MKTILIAHRDAAVRDRFAAALADARHRFVAAASDAEATAAVADSGLAISLAIVDLGLAADGVPFVRRLHQAAAHPVPVVVFSGSIAAAGDVPRLAAMGISAFVNEHAATPEILPALAPHLFPDNFNRRTSPRVALGVPISYRAGQTIAGAVTLDVGKGGLAVRTMNPLPEGTAIQVKFRLPGSATDLEAAGRIAWSDRKVGMGVQFDTITPADQAVIDEFVDRHQTDAWL